MNGVEVQSGDDYCNAIGLSCLQLFDDKDSCRRGKEYKDCSETDGDTSDHIVRCGKIGKQRIENNIINLH